ncbi:MAG: D-lyxose/D-mannose family sugar isomerase [Solobacterium sp.]|nr:D-lyxose/D-mannose family sugar isomerase [Solobacterium sp.]
MKRSEINSIIREMEQLITDYRISLPPFCNWTPEQWQHRGHEYDEIRDNMLGWDITDYGLNNYNNTGFALITLRSGSQTDDRYPKPYAEKLLYLRENQLAPMHFHWIKMEDIINRGGGDLDITVYNDDGNGGLADTNVTVHSDGRVYTVPAGTAIRLHPGESITITPYLYHEFHGVPGTGSVLIGEVSRCNDDSSDNRFYEPIGRFPAIEEDEEPYRLLCFEYPPAQ